MIFRLQLGYLSQIMLCMCPLYLLVYVTIEFIYFDTH